MGWEAGKFRLLSASQNRLRARFSSYGQSKSAAFARTYERFSGSLRLQPPLTTSSNRLTAFFWSSCCFAISASDFFGVSLCDRTCDADASATTSNIEEKMRRLDLRIMRSSSKGIAAFRLTETI